ncbi:MAG: hypothetical protein JW902_03690 [Syntrophaceae bacterium]|nr:hypothetical protein [Syntrophaceae bacterium]
MSFPLKREPERSGDLRFPESRFFSRFAEKRGCVVLRTDLRHAAHGSGSLRFDSGPPLSRG